MATTEKTGLLTHIDASGNKTILYPATIPDAVDGLAELLAEKVEKTALKNLAYSQTDANGNYTVQTLSAYPTAPGVFRVGAPISGLPSGISGYGPLVIFDGGSYYLHLYKDSNNSFYTARTAEMGAPAASLWTCHNNQWDLIWETTNHTGSFSAQTLSYDLSKYKHIKIEWYPVAIHGSNYPFTTTEGIIGTPMQGIAYGNDGTGGFGWIGNRYVELTVNGVTFRDGGYVVISDGTKANHNDYCIPVRIWAKRG